jgi:tol-pal system protein YbgF
MKSLAAALMSLAIAAVPAAAQTLGSRAPGDGNAALSARLERLEQQIADLQGVVAAVETLAKNNSGGSGGYGAASGASSEQIRQLSEQIAELTQRLERLEARDGGEGGGRPPAGLSRQGSGYGPSSATGFEDKEQLPPLAPPQGGPAAGYGARPQQNASAGQQRPYGSYEPAGVPPRVAPPPAQPPQATASAGTPARMLFDQATGALNRREYSAAETYFQQFIDQYPADALVGSAQYWLGETAFVSGEYKTAADRFLKTFTDYPTNERAPEALLKLAISLRRLGNNTDACATFTELARRYPRASQSVQQRADAEKKRANCS